MKVRLQHIRDKMRSVLKSKHYTAEEIDFIIEMYLGGELRGHISHGLASFADFVNKDFSQLPEPKVIKETNSLFMIDAMSNSGNLLGKRAADEAIKRASREAVGMSLITNMESWLRPGAIAQYIADKGYVAFVLNNGGGTSIAPPGGYDPTLGTNPIAYGIPTAENSLVVDMATSKKAWGQVRLANKYGKDLPVDTFYNDKGQLTLDSQEVYSVLPFGGYKGYALALMVEILCGSLVGTDMMVDRPAANKFGAKHPERGGFILVIDPRQTVGLEEFKEENTEILEKIKSTSRLEGETIRIPGEKAGKIQQEAIEADSIDIPEELWTDLQAL